jgi:hypothetical protein
MRYDSLRYDGIEQLPFDLVGEFLGFVLNKQDQPRALRLVWLGREVVIKVAKSLRDDRYDECKWKSGERNSCLRKKPN